MQAVCQRGGNDVAYACRTGAPGNVPADCMLVVDWEYTQPWRLSDYSGAAYFAQAVCFKNSIPLLQNGQLPITYPYCIFNCQTGKQQMPR
ncbi:hypothetical protein BAUCODRAFT_33063 [Baudoinia panamericana UAMH 10762]|uniref:Uncharacterized protein n=1 Tax=Baudoinia panamericana (strain UAMH 10762) TaxID=717646 RepID=M2LS93_BAUPA|nr:uncharacterized protein BAUCODRAFT_33063 [Baudoinia panamericana UAMH 10762]EMC97342.1 hypothetical protein BAUCODRAFT_33063 [Baudoinia panamericana UAMH 10762]